MAQDEGDHLAAAQSYKRAVDLDFHYVDALVNLGLTLKELCQPELTRECFELILQKQTGHPMAGVNLAKFHLEQNHPPAAEAACRSVLEVHPTHAEALLNLGVALQAQNRTLDAIAAYEEIVAHNPDYPDRQFNIAFSELMAGRWQSGWQHYEARWGTDNPVFSPRHPHVQAWNGEPLSGKRLLFFAEQGYGDTLQFCRFAPLLSSAGATVIIECQPGLKSLLESIPNVEQVVEQGEAIPAVDFKLPMMSAPLVFGITPENILNGSDGRYLTAPAAEGICSEGRLKVGLVWSGRERSVLNNRSLPSAMLPELFQQTAGIVEWFSLQKEEPVEAAEIITTTPNVTRMGSQITDLESTARLVNAMDVVVTIDTAMAHLAGALGQAEADLDKDGAVSVLEAFLIASRKVGEYYRENDRLVSENALLDDNGDGRGTPADWFRGVRIEKKAKGNNNADGLLSRLVFPVVPAAEKEISEPLRKKRAEVEAKIETLRSLKKSLEADVYYRDLEKLFLELASINDEIETAQSASSGGADSN